jgi:hypothetical protein
VHPHWLDADTKLYVHASVARGADHEARDEVIATAEKFTAKGVHGGVESMLCWASGANQHVAAFL